jgi:hypothetical protein
MTQDEIKVLEKSFGKPTPEWIKAFHTFNNEPSNRKLSMNCRSCWMKVLQWHKSKSE